MTQTSVGPQGNASVTQAPSGLQLESVTAPPPVAHKTLQHGKSPAGRPGRGRTTALMPASSRSVASPCPGRAHQVQLILLNTRCKHAAARRSDCRPGTVSMRANSLRRSSTSGRRGTNRRPVVTAYNALIMCSSCCRSAVYSARSPLAGLALSVPTVFRSSPICC